MYRRGDTIIEVLVAVSIFSFVAISALTLMNHGLSMAQRALEITLVRQQLDSQAEMLRFIVGKSQSDGEYGGMWNGLKSRAVEQPQSILGIDQCPASSEMNNIFFLSSRTGGGIEVLTAFKPGLPDTYAKLARVGGAVQSQGLMVQLVPVGAASGAGRAYDAYVQACWTGPGSTRPATIGTIVRIYDPSA